MKKFVLPVLGILMLSMLFFPGQSIAAASSALALWWQVILPSLLPFFIMSELLISLGVMRYMGKWMEPLMRPIFNLPGTASLAVVMGFTSGFPTGAAITAGLRRQGAISCAEGNRLLAFTNNSSPLFIVAGLATGMLHSPQAGILLAAVHYGTNLCTGIVLGIFSRKKSKQTAAIPQHMEISNLPLGALLKKSTQKALSNITLIGCYLVFFSVIIQMLESLGFNNILSFGIEKVLMLMHLPTELADAFGNGLWEMTLGTATAADSNAPFALVAAACSAIMAWGGFSIQAQVAAMVSDTDLNIKTYILCSAVQACVAFNITRLLVKNIAVETLTNTNAVTATSPITASIIFLCISILLLLILFLSALTGRRIKVFKRGRI